MQSSIWLYQHYDLLWTQLVACAFVPISFTTVEPTLRNLKTLVESDITESTQQKVMDENFKCFSYPWYAWHFSSQVPPSEQLTEAECRIAWHRDLMNPNIEKCTMKVLNRKTGRYEDTECMYIDVSHGIRKEQIAAQKRQTATVTTKANPTQKNIERSTTSVLSFLSMQADDEFFSATRVYALVIFLILQHYRHMYDIYNIPYQVLNPDILLRAGYLELRLRPSIHFHICTLHTICLSHCKRRIEFVPLRFLSGVLVRT